MSPILDSMKTMTIRSPEDLGLVVRAVRKAAGVRQDDLAGIARVSRQFAVDVERGKPTLQLGRALRVLAELGISLQVELADDAAAQLERLQARPRKT